MKPNNSKRDFAAAIVVGIVLMVALPGLAFEVSYAGKIYPGISVGGQMVGGLSQIEAEGVLVNRIQKMEKLSLKWGVNDYVLDSKLLNIAYDVSQSVKNAALVGRSGNLLADVRTKLKLLRHETDVEISRTIDAAAISETLRKIAQEIDIPEKEPEIQISGDEKSLSVTQGENGQRVNTFLLRQKIEDAYAQLNPKKIDIPVEELRPKLTEIEMQNVKSKAEPLLGKNLILEDPHTGQKWVVGARQILTWLDIKPGKFSYEKIRLWVDELAKTIDKPPQNASFKFVDPGKVQEFKPGKKGVILQKSTMSESIAMALESLEQTATTELAINIETVLTDPDTGAEDVNDLGIVELIGKGESWFSGSITNRIFNLKKSADAINGTLVAPGEIFSFNKTVGEISGDTGYKQAYIIKEGKTILGDGGGVCQVSSTLFRAALNTGLPIEERTAHAYRVHYYEEKYQPGFDATVFQPAPDFKFRNDTSRHILIQTVFDEKAKYLAIEIYGTSDGRKAEVSKSRIWEVTPPPPDLYQDDPTLPLGKIVQVEHSAWGAKVAFDWKVTRGDEVLQQRTFYSNYKNWQAVYLRGTKI